jgi:elongation factor Ts
MANITAKEVNALRQKTGAGMMDCKKALVEANGDMEAAIDLLRKKGQKVAAKRGENETNEGLVYARANGDNKTGIIMALSCETDFVAKNSDFQAFVESLVDIAMNNTPETVEDLKALKYDDKLTVEEKITEQIGVIGEKLEINGYAKLNAETVVPYIHPGNQIATLVALNKNVDTEIGRQVAMQIAAMNPLAVDESGVDQETIDREIEVGKEKAIEEGKPAEMAENIAKGRLKKFFKENTLLHQAFIKDNKKSVADFLKETESDLTVTSFKRVALK